MTGGRRRKWPKWLDDARDDGTLTILAIGVMSAALVVFYALASQLIFWLLS